MWDYNHHGPGPGEGDGWGWLPGVTEEVKGKCVAQLSDYNQLMQLMLFSVPRCWFDTRDDLRGKS